MGGDFNTKHTDWGARLVTNKGGELRKTIRETGCNFHSIGKPTYWPTDRNKISDLLDFFITKNISQNIMEIEEIFIYIPIIQLLTLSKKIILKKEAGPMYVIKTYTG